MQTRPSSLNAYKHGLTGQTLILTAEDKPAYDQHCQSYVDLYLPVGRPEQLLVQIIADDYWRALRARALETAQMSQIFDHTSNPTLEPRQEKTLGNLALYIQRIERSIRNNTRALQEMQTQRQEAGRQADSSHPADRREADSDPAAERQPQQKQAAAAPANLVFSPAVAAPPSAREDRPQATENLPAADSQPVSTPAKAGQMTQAA
ncbi:MAG TPA: hypothetical protein VN841_19970 [Bryobacteraceae bacterium]|nr:hypothetical protein [Bryobacteraceae bacterium]